MILIEERKSKKLPNLTSLFFKLPFFSKQVGEQICQLKNWNYDKKSGEYEIAITRLFFIVNLLIKLDDVRFVPFKEKQTILQTCKGTHFKYKPYSYQIDGIDYGLNHNGWLLLDDAGLGKTLQMIYLAEVLKKKENLKHCLVICGVNTLKFNWASEIEKLSNLDYKILGTRVRKNGTQYIGSVQDRLDDLQKPLKEFFAITNIETLQDKKFVEAFKKSKNKFDLIVLDEAHRVKNPSAKATKTLLKLSAPRVIALTGTLIMNNPENAYVALKWTHNLSCTYSAFNAMYNVYGGFGGVQVISHKNLDLLQEHIASCSLRRKKEDVLDLPPKTYQKEYVELLPEQRKLYNDVLKQITEELDNLSKRQKITIQEEMVMNMRLRQITAYPGILSSTVTQSAKLDRLEEIVEDVTSQGDKVLVFCSFKSTVPEIKQRLAQYNPLICTGDTPDFEINYNKKRFQENPDNKVMVCTWQKMGTGHTLTAANYVIFIDTPWTDADFQQSADRAYRIGQTKHTHIITLICKDTYDERVQEILDRKEMLSSYLIDKADNSLFQCSDFDEFD